MCCTTQAQALRRAEDELGDSSIEIGDGRVHVGDQVVTRVNRGGRHPVHNRERWVVEANEPTARRVTLRHQTETECSVTLDAEYLDRRPVDAGGSVELGYAMTKYAAQGMTVDRAFVVLGDGLSKEEAYTAFTRARESTELYAVTGSPSSGPRSLQRPTSGSLTNTPSVSPRVKASNASPHDLHVLLRHRPLSIPRPERLRSDSTHPAPVGQARLNVLRLEPI